MKIYLTKIYAELKAWRNERKITAESQKDGYTLNVMEEFGELAQALRGLEFENIRKTAEHEIIDAICDIAVFTINAGADIPAKEKITIIDTTTATASLNTPFNATILCSLVEDCMYFASDPGGKSGFIPDFFNQILVDCAKLCEHYGFNFEIAMLETIKEISSRTGSYDKASKKWIKDTSNEARAKWYKANYELARL